MLGRVETEAQQQDMNKQVHRVGNDGGRVGDESRDERGDPGADVEGEYHSEDPVLSSGIMSVGDDLFIVAAMLHLATPQVLQSPANSSW